MTKPQPNPEFGETLQSETVDYDGKMRKRIAIDVADMQIALIQFKSNVIRRQFAVPFFGLVGAWLPIVSSDFKPIMGLKADTVQGVYFGVVLCISVFILKTWLGPASSLVGFISRKENREVITTSEPEELANILHKKGSNS